MEIKIKTDKKKQVINLTEKLNLVIAKQKIESGLCHVFVKHTTCAVTIAELDPGTDEDLLEVVEKMIPRIQFRHAHDPSHAWEHMASTLLGASASVPYKHKKLNLGTWQSVVLAEFSGPRQRKLNISFLDAKDKKN